MHNRYFLPHAWHAKSEFWGSVTQSPSSARTFVRGTERTADSKVRADHPRRDWSLRFDDNRDIRAESFQREFGEQPAATPATGDTQAGSGAVDSFAEKDAVS